MKSAKKNALSAAISLALGAGALLPVAAQAGWYAGVGIGSSSFDDEVGTQSALADAIRAQGPDSASFKVDDSDSGWKIFGGFQFNEYFALEGQYVDIGSAKTSASGSYDGGEGGGQAFSGSGEVDVTGFGVNAVGSLPFMDNHFSLVGKIGVFRWMADQSGTTSLGGGGDWCAANACGTDDEGIEVTYGAGLDWHITDRITARALWENFNLENDGADFYTASIIWGF
ncbi:MAG: outer membrane beta-barrel protein [Gammaproteobacteria bacterium]|nr:outer membrane beta-barrel protein [Gammaproteobacteria bacterium]QOJ30951.1 MAG: outer membrane beta-barrel protein [Gammaproteobacteria bacterium]